MPTPASITHTSSTSPTSCTESTTSTHCVVIPSYNSGRLLQTTVESVLSLGLTVFAVTDGSTDGSDSFLDAPAYESHPLLHVIRFRKNQGKGAAALAGMQAAFEHNFTHAVLFDSDGQHAASDIPAMIGISNEHPDRMVLGKPIFGDDAPLERVHARRIANWFANLSARRTFIADSLFGFRVYPIRHALECLRETTRGRAFDFETQIAVRLAWRGVSAINFATRVTYPARDKGGVSHFDYVRDNLLLIRSHAGLLAQAFFSRRIRLGRNRAAQETIARELPPFPAG
jgi:glycosyltransferase involved in cell wall biosynthesis